MVYTNISRCRYNNICSVAWISSSFVDKEIRYCFPGTLQSLWEGDTHSFTARRKIMFPHISYREETYLVPSFENKMWAQIVPWEFGTLTHVHIAEGTNFKLVARGAPWHALRHSQFASWSSSFLRLSLAMAGRHGPSPTNLWEEPGNASLLSSRQNLISSGVDWGPCMRFLAERKSHTLCFGLGGEASGSSPLFQRGG